MGKWLGSCQAAAGRVVSRPSCCGGAATWNRELATLRAAVGWWRRRGWLAVDLTGELARRRERVDRTRPSPTVSLKGCLAAGISR
jgi:hypothetical protein